MRVAWAVAVVSLLLVASSGRAADPVYLDEIVETPLPTLQTMFTGLKKEGCYRIAAEQYVLITIDKKDAKPWRVLLSSLPPCKRAETGPAIDLRARSGVELGQSQVTVVQRMGRPEVVGPPEKSMSRYGEVEFFYICRVSPECARHTSVYFKDDAVSAISEWYSE